MAGPLDQFQIKPIVPLEIAGYDVSFTNSSAWMMATVILTLVLFTVGLGRRSLVPGRMQSVAELMYEFIGGMIRDNLGSKEGKRYFPFVFSIFMIVLLGNILGMIPYSFTYTSHIIVTFALAFFVFIVVTLIGIARHGLHFLSFFVPKGVPLPLIPLIALIEVISYFSRPISLSVRLFANMMAGHTMLKVFAGFSVSMGVIFGLAPLVINVALVGFEILVACLQAYVFTILTCLYLKDAIELH